MKKMKKPRKAVIDGDIIVWKTAFVVDAEGELVIDSLLNGLIKKWTPKGVKDLVVALSCKGRDNFRKKIFPGYKSNRAKQYQPDCLGLVFEAIQDSFPCITIPTLEADDILGMQCSSGKAIAVTIDKDLMGVPGWHLNPDKHKNPKLITKEEAERFFCTQWLAGDVTDGVPGLWRIGKKKAEKILDKWEPEDWHQNILDMYAEEKYAPKNKYDLDNLCEAMGQCVRILHHENYDFINNEIRMWKPKVGL